MIIFTRCPLTHKPPTHRHAEQACVLPSLSRIWSLFALTTINKKNNLSGRRHVYWSGATAVFSRLFFVRLPRHSLISVLLDVPLWLLWVLRSSPLFSKQHGFREFHLRLVDSITGFLWHRKSHIPVGPATQSALSWDRCVWPELTYTFAFSATVTAGFGHCKLRMAVMPS